MKDDGQRMIFSDEDEESAAEFIEGVDAGEGSAPDITTENETPQNDE